MHAPVVTLGTAGARIRVWDVAVRIVHWLLVPAIIFMWWTAEEGKLNLHRYSGYFIATLLIFRLLWGLFGSDTARFSRFVRGPAGVRAYLRGEGGEPVGHSPLGALSVVALLGLLATQVFLGLFAVDTDGIESGPFSHFVSFEDGRRAAERHELVFNLLLGFIALHIGAIIWYRVKGRNLVRPMVLGWREARAGEAQPRMAPGWRALLLAVVAWGVVAFALKHWGQGV